MRPRLTIVIPTYRRPEALDRALSSVVANLTEDIRPLVEVLVREDHSGPDYIVRYQSVQATYAQDSHFDFNENNLGMADNLRRLVDEARGDFVLILSDDDQVAEGGLQVLLATLDRAERHSLGCLLLPRHSYRENGEKVTVSSRTVGFGKVRGRPRSALRLCTKGFILTGMVFRPEFTRTFEWDRFNENAYFPVALQYHILQMGGGLRARVKVVIHTVYNETHWHRWGHDASSQRDRLGRDYLSMYDALSNDALQKTDSRMIRRYLRYLQWLNTLRLLVSHALNPHPKSDDDSYAAWLRIQSASTLRSSPAYFFVTRGSRVLAWVVRSSRWANRVAIHFGRLLIRGSKLDRG